MITDLPPRRANPLPALAGAFDSRETFVVLPPGVTQLVAADPLRVCLLITQSVGGQNYLTTSPAAAPGQGWPIADNTDDFRLIFSREGQLTQLAWYANVAGAPATFTVWEVDYHPERV